MNNKLKNIKASNRGITFSDENLFPIGTKYTYIVDQQNKKVTIVPSTEEGTHVVSRKKRKNGFVPLIDIRNNQRNKEAINALAGCTHLQISIQGDEVIVEGYVEEAKEKSGIFSKITQQVKKALRKKEQITSSNVFDISDILQVKKQARIVLSKQELSKVAGEQLSLFEDFSWEVATDSGTRSISNVSDILTNLDDSIIPLQVASIFSGAGIMDLGFKQAGYDLKFALELDEAAVMTYRHNLGDHIVCADATEFDMSLIPQVPVMIGGSPCKPYTNANRKQKRLLHHPDNRLYMNFVDSVKKNPNCKVWVLENVPQILSAEGAYFKEEIMEELSEFEITVGVLNSADFGAAQLRKRAIFIGSKIGKINLPEPYLTPDEHLTVGEAFRGLHTSLPNFFDWSKPKKETVERMKYVPQGGNFLNIPPEIRKGSHSNYHARLDWYKPSITIVNPRKSLITHPFENRIISIREAARLFGVPDNFSFLGKIKDMQQQICNAVPVNLSQAVATVIKNAIGQFNIRSRKIATPIY